MRAGRLRKRLTLQSVTTTFDDTGDAIEAWSDVKTVYASVTPLTGTEVITANQLGVGVDFEIRVRYGVGPITHDQRFLMGDRIFNVVSILNPDERNRELVIGAKEGLQA